MTYTAEIIAVGTELLLGNVANTNARDLSEGLSALGINVFFHTVVGDNPGRLKSAVEIAKGRSDIIITTGGLGPTCDDITKEVLAECFDKKLVFIESEAALIRSYFEERLHHSKMTENNLRQALLPEDCTIFRNQRGTAPGCAFYAQNKHILMLPGPPGECNAMFQNCAVPYLKTLSDSEILSHSIMVFGIGESEAESRLRDLMLRLNNPTLAPYAKAGEVMLRLTAKGKDQAEAEALMQPVLTAVRAELGDLIYGVDTSSLEATVLNLLIAQNKTLSSAESCTGGLLSKRITDVPGASRAFLGGVTAYANEIKTSLLDVSAELIAQKGAVCKEVAVAMAKGVRSRMNTDFGIGITGLAGPGGSEGGKEIGTVFVSLSADDGVYTRSLHLGNDRSRVRTLTANHALDMIRRYLTGLPVESADLLRNSGVEG